MLALKILGGGGENLHSTMLFSMAKGVWISSLRKVIDPNTFSTLLYVICDKKNGKRLLLSGHEVLLSVTPEFFLKQLTN